MKIDLEHVDDLARGAAILGTGGGGDPYIGSLMLKQAIEDHGPVDLIDVEALCDDDFVAPFAMMGAPTVLIEKLPNGDEMLAALRTIERIAIARPARFCAPKSAASTHCYRWCSARAVACPWSTATGMGRAFPQLQW